MMDLSAKAKVFIVIVVLSGFAVLADALWHASSENGMRFISFLLVACLAARLNVKLPDMSTAMCVNLPFILVAVAEMSAAEALVVACASTLAQCLPRTDQKLNWTRTLFNIANIGLAADVTRLLYNSGALQSAIPTHSLLLAVAAAGYFAANSISVAIILGLAEQRNVMRAWVAMLQLSYPYYLASAGVAAVVVTASAHVGWQVPLMVLPLMVGMFYSYKRYFSATAVAQEEVKAASRHADVAHAVS